MKFFKHYTSAHRGQSLRQIADGFGMDGIGRYWVLVELCAEKLSIASDKECRFTFSASYLRDVLRFHSFKGMYTYLDALMDCGLIDIEVEGGDSAPNDATPLESSNSLRSHFELTSKSLRSHFEVESKSLRNQFEIVIRMPNLLKHMYKNVAQGGESTPKSPRPRNTRYKIEDKRYKIKETPAVLPAEELQKPPLPDIAELDQSVTRSTDGKPSGRADKPPAVAKEAKVIPVPSGPNPVTVYCDAYKARYGHSPTIGPKQAGVLMRLQKSYKTKTVDIINGYFAMPSPFLIERSHPVELIDSKLNEITRYLATGKVVTKAHSAEMNDRLDEAMGPKEPGIAEIRAMRAKRLTGGDE